MYVNKYLPIEVLLMLSVCSEIRFDWAHTGPVCICPPVNHQRHNAGWLWSKWV